MNTNHLPCLSMTFELKGEFDRKSKRRTDGSGGIGGGGGGGGRRHCHAPNQKLEALAPIDLNGNGIFVPLQPVWIHWPKWKTLSSTPIIF